MVYKKVQQSIKDRAIQKKISQLNPSAVDQQVQTDSSSAKVTNTNIPSEAKRDAITRGIFGIGVKSVQTKLTIGEPRDKYEQEADRVATQVINQIHSSASVQPGQNQNVQHEAIAENNKLQMKPMVQLQASDGSMTATSELETSIQQARGGG